jgi:hypothetical protein
MWQQRLYLIHRSGASSSLSLNVGLIPRLSDRADQKIIPFGLVVHYHIIDNARIPPGQVSHTRALTLNAPCL